MVHTTTVPFKWNNTTYYDCRGAEMDEFKSKLYNTSVFVMTFALPLLIQSFAYGSIGRKLMSDQLINNKLPLRRNTQDRDRVKVFKVFGCFWICLDVLSLDVLSLYVLSCLLLEWGLYFILTFRSFIIN